MGSRHNSLTTQQKTLKSSSKNWVFGGKEGRSGEFYIGALDEIRVYNRLLSLSEIGLLSNGHQPHNPSPADGVHEQPVSELTLHWNPSLNPSIPDEPNPAITGYYLYYRLNDANFDDSGTTMVAIDADADHDGITDPTVSYGPLNFGAETTVYWKVFESLNNSTPA
jgi:hypothetical protein